MQPSKSSVNASRGSWRRMRTGAGALLLVAALPSCDIETEPLGVLTSESFFKTPEQAIQATNATYSMLREWQVHVFSWIGLTDIASDDATKGSVPGDANFLGELDNLNFSAAEPALIDPWSGYFRGIYRANVAIAGIPSVSMDPVLQARLIAENKFLRAYFYFFLVRAFGGVPLITTPLTPGEFTQPRATAAAIYAQIEQDLTEAIAALPEKSAYAAADLGRASKGAARALLAEAHLYQGDFAGAVQEAQAVIASNQYSLFPNYETLFTRSGENSSESVFEVGQIALATSNAGGQYQQVQGVRGTPNIGWGFNTPSPELEDSYEPGDPRLHATVLYPWELLPDGSGRVVHQNPSMPNNRYNQKVLMPLADPPGSGNGGTNIRRIRYAHVLLTGAEAAARSAQEGMAQNWLNLVRARARGGRSITLGTYVELLSNSIAENVIGMAPGTSRVVVRFVDPDDAAYTAGHRSFSSECVGTCPSTSPPPVRVLNADIITAVDATTVTNLTEYYNALDTKAPGQPVTLSVLRVTQSAGSPPTTTSTPMVITVQAQLLLPPVVAAGQQLLDAIWAERRAELAMEQHRWFDLVRQGRAQQAMALAGKTFVPGKHELYPIPGSQVTAFGLQQNPGW